MVPRPASLGNLLEIYKSQVPPKPAEWPLWAGPAFCIRTSHLGDEFSSLRITDLVQPLRFRAGRTEAREGKSLSKASQGQVSVWTGPNSLFPAPPDSSRSPCPSSPPREQGGVPAHRTAPREPCSLCMVWGGGPGWAALLTDVSTPPSAQKEWVGWKSERAT